MLYELDYTDTLGASVLKIDEEHADFGGYCAYGEQPMNGSRAVPRGLSCFQLSYVTDDAIV